MDDSMTHSLSTPNTFSHPHHFYHDDLSLDGPSGDVLVHLSSAATSDTHDLDAAPLPAVDHSRRLSTTLASPSSGLSPSSRIKTTAYDETGSSLLSDDDDAAARELCRRTLLICLPHARQHIESIRDRLDHAGFIVPAEDDWDADEGVLRRDLRILDRDLAASFIRSIQEPCYLWVLERRGAHKVLLELLGNSDPVIARASSPQSLQAIYGGRDPALWTPSSAERAEEHVELFFPGLSPVGSSVKTQEQEFPLMMGDLAGEVVEKLYDYHDGSESIADLDAPLSVSASGSASDYKSQISAIPPPLAAFKARPAPLSTHKPDRPVRQSRASLLRSGVDPATLADASTKRRESGISLTDFQTVPGYKRSPSSLKLDVASVRPPAIAPRESRASLARQGRELPPVRARRTSAERSIVFEGVPGHKRRESIAVSSLSTPTVVPRPSRASILRSGDVQAWEAKQEETRLARVEATAALKAAEERRLEHRKSLMKMPASLTQPAVKPRPTRASLLRTTGSGGSPVAASTPPPTALKHRRSTTSHASPTSRPASSLSALSRSSSVLERRPSSVDSAAMTGPQVKQTRSALLRAGLPVAPSSPHSLRRTNLTTNSTLAADSTFVGVPGHKRRESIAVSSTAQPQIAPRQTKASLLRTGFDPASLPPAPRPTRLSSATATLGGGARPASSASTTIPSSGSSSSNKAFLPNRSASVVPPPPSISVRTNRAAALRSLSGVGSAGGGSAAPPSAFGARLAIPPGSAMAAVTGARTSGASSRPPSAFAMPVPGGNATATTRAPMPSASGGGAAGVRDNRAAELRKLRRTSVTF